MTHGLSLKDFEIRYKNIRETFPNIQKCSVKGCNNPRDITEVLGEDTTCAYHRLLFDYWLYEVVQPDWFNQYFQNQRVRRSAFTRWWNRTGKETCDRIVLRMARDGINWKC